MILYHYTTAEGLLGIIKSKSLWASDYRFLNDDTELKYGSSILEQILTKVSQQIPPDAEDFIRMFLEAMPNYSVLIASFCEAGDLLSQWRGYNGGIGYAIGFNKDWLHRTGEMQGFNLIPVQYEQADQHMKVTDKLNLLLNLMADVRSVAYLRQNWIPNFIMTLAALKNSHFREEEEWRLVKSTFDMPPGICARATSRAGLVPYLPIGLNKQTVEDAILIKNIGIEEIVVGPGLPDRQKIAVDGLLASKGMRVAIRKSSIPYSPNP